MYSWVLLGLLLVFSMLLNFHSELPFNFENIRHQPEMIFWLALSACVFFGWLGGYMNYKPVGKKRDGNDYWETTTSNRSATYLFLGCDLDQPAYFILRSSKAARFFSRHMPHGQSDAFRESLPGVTLIAEDVAATSQAITDRPELVSLLKNMFDEQVLEIAAFGTRLQIKAQVPYGSAIKLRLMEQLNKYKTGQLQDLMPPMQMKPKFLDMLQRIKAQLADFGSALETGEDGLRRVRLFAGMNLGFWIAAVAVPFAIVSDTYNISLPAGGGLSYIGVALSICLGWYVLIKMAFPQSGWGRLAMRNYIIAGILPLFLASIWMIREADIGFDRQPPVPWVKQLHRKVCDIACTQGSGKHSHTYYLQPSAENCAPEKRARTLADTVRAQGYCNDGGHFRFRFMAPAAYNDLSTLRSFDVRQSLFDDVPVQGYFTIVTHAGALGMQWFDSDEMSAYHGPHP